ncbi:hypothetical protein CA267_005240 [Alteromonas pelagimontana]|uniref:Porin family protein n=1 Tax=Alteromonas pelagimontana TaxID=1858656 RepID=A0A6M4MC45_9ALTE|nr:hypothetical protein [Alteromonas pelagimontana]QJR80220.1 hypothetical protein CA267_005240 [Alteromonas pelagimontana]
MKSTWSFVTIAMMVVANATAGEAEGISSITSLYASPYQTEISYRSKRLPKWSFGVKYNRKVNFHPLWVDSISENPSIDSIRLSAARMIPMTKSQRIFASVQTSNDHNFDVHDWVYLPANAGTAASLGWQLGASQDLNLAVEYEYREVGEVDISSLLLGVQYYF